ncbi:MAG: radical SAM protein [bacterium]|nr:radical SAM protein [bacterium]
MSSLKPLVFDIVRGSCVDGPGLRSVVFLKGCPLRCVWCHNPESYEVTPDLLFDAERCRKCGNCLEGRPCFPGARRVVGQYYPPSELIELLLRDRLYYEQSGGGVTFSGGEPTLFMHYLEKILPCLQAEGIDVALQTSGYFPFIPFASRLLPFINRIAFDLKLIDADLHLAYTGVSNDLIKANLTALVSCDVELSVRVPLVPELTATRSNLDGIALFLRQLGIEGCEFMAYNPSGLSKWKQLDRTPPVPLPEEPMTRAELERWCAYFESRGTHAAKA